MIFFEGGCDGVHEMRFSQADISVDEEGIGSGIVPN